MRYVVKMVCATGWRGQQRFTKTWCGQTSSSHPSPWLSDGWYLQRSWFIFSGWWTVLHCVVFFAIRGEHDARCWSRCHLLSASVSGQEKKRFAHRGSNLAQVLWRQSAHRSRSGCFKFASGAVVFVWRSCKERKSLATVLSPLPLALNAHLWWMGLVVGAGAFVSISLLDSGNKSMEMAAMAMPGSDNVLGSALAAKTTFFNVDYGKFSRSTWGSHLSNSITQCVQSTRESIILTHRNNHIIGF